MRLAEAEKEKARKVKKIDEAIWLINHENFDEALVLFQELRKEDPNSSIAAYYLGLTLKQVQRYKEAKPELEAAATLTPRVDNAIPELIDLLFKLEEFDEAKKWIETAEKDNIAPAQTAFIKGMILLRENKDTDATIAAFDKAKSLDESL
ncbi:MAG: tetratricopeptide repeat protein, partial [Candidatus Omnitrophota bacterium]